MNGDDTKRLSVVHESVRSCAFRAKQGAAALAAASDAEIDAAILGMAQRLGTARRTLLTANEEDLAAAVAAGPPARPSARLRMVARPRARGDRDHRHGRRPGARGADRQ